MLLNCFRWMLCSFVFGAAALPAADLTRGPAFGEGVRKSEPLSPADEQKKFKLPPGFEIQLVASEPAINKPINMAFDEKGRLWVTSTVEYPWPVKQGEKARDAIKVLSDFGDDGLAKTVTTFAEGLNIPIGLLPYRGGVIAHSIPEVSFYQDTDGDGKADKVEKLAGPFGFDKDTHGMTSSFRRGLDGMFYACHGFNNTSQVTAKDGSQIKMTSGNTYRMKLDGTKIEQFTFGQVNPFGLCFDTLGDLYSADCHTLPIYLLLRGSCYPSFGKPDDGLGFGPTIMKHAHGSTAIGGIVVYSDTRFPKEYHNNIFVGNVMTCRINRDSLATTGSSRAAVEQPDLLSTEDPWFRPVDMQLGPDGALYIADFYNRIIGHYEVDLKHPGRDRERGRIWRIVYKGEGAAPVATTDLSKDDAAQLIERLKDANPTLRSLATAQLVDRVGAAGTDALKKAAGEGSPTQKIHALWSLFQFGAVDEVALTRAAADADGTVRVHAMRTLAEIANWNDTLRAAAIKGLRDADPFVKRAATDALGMHPTFEHIRPLLDLRKATPNEDVHLVHTIRMAIRNQLRGEKVLAKAATAEWSDDDQRTLVDVALGVASEDAGRFLAKQLPGSKDKVESMQRALKHAARNAPAEDLGPLVDALQKRYKEEWGAVQLINAFLQGLAQRGMVRNDALRDWGVAAASKALEKAGDNDSIKQSLEVAQALKEPALAGKIPPILAKADLPIDLREAAGKALIAIDAVAAVLPLMAIVKNSSESAQTREKIAALVGGIPKDEARTALVEALVSSPHALQSKLAVALGSSKDGAALLVKTIGAGKAPPQLLLDRALKDRLNSHKSEDLNKQVAELSKNLKPIDNEIQSLIVKKRDGYKKETANADLGAKIFEKNCMICHSLEGKGAIVGPHLDGVGARGLERIIEDVVDPNRNVDVAFRSSLVKLKNGQLVSGLQRREDGQLLILVDSTGKEVPVPKGDILETRTSTSSLMPDNFAETIPAEEFNHLMAFLMSKAEPAKPKAP